MRGFYHSLAILAAVVTGECDLRHYNILTYVSLPKIGRSLSYLLHFTSCFCAAPKSRLLAVHVLRQHDHIWQTTLGLVTRRLFGSLFRIYVMRYNKYTMTVPTVKMH